MSEFELYLSKLSMAAHTCNPSTQETKAGSVPTGCSVGMFALSESGERESMEGKETEGGRTEKKLKLQSRKAKDENAPLGKAPYFF